MKDPFRSIEMEWTGTGHQFRARGLAPASPEVLIDGDNEVGASPMQHLLMAAASCASVDVVMILQKMRVDLTGTAVKVTGRRREEHPRRFEHIEFVFEVSANCDDLQNRADRAVALSIEKYCSVMHTLAPDLEIATKVLVV